MGGEYKEGGNEAGRHMWIDWYGFQTGKEIYRLLSSRSTCCTLRPKNVVNEGIFSILSPHNFVTSATEVEIDSSLGLLSRQQLRGSIRYLVLGDRRVSRRVKDVSIPSRCPISIRNALQNY